MFLIQMSDANDNNLSHPIFLGEIKIKLENDLKAIVICLNYYYSKSIQAKILKSYCSGGIY